MKQLLSLALALIPFLAWAQYPSNGNQKITLGEQTTADGLIWRGVLADTGIINPSSDTSAYIILDTVNHRFYNYNRATNVWSVAGGGTAVTSITGGTGLTGGTITSTGTLAADTNFLVTRFDTASMLTNYYRSGRAGIIQASDVPTLNQNTTGSAATLTTSRTFQTNLASTSTASFNGSANVTPGVTGTLPVANGGTNTTTLTANKIMVGNGTSGVLTPTNLHWDNTNSRLGIGTSTPFGKLSVANTNTVVEFSEVTSTELAFEILNSARSLSVDYSIYNKKFNVFGRSGGSGSYTNYFTVLDNATVGIGTTTPQSGYRLHVVDSVYIGGNVSASAYTTRSDYNLKDDIFELKYGLNDILELKPVEYTYKSNGSKQLGFIAQDIGTILPEVVSFEESMSVNYQAIIPILTKAIQEQQALIKALEQRIINLENK